MKQGVKNIHVSYWWSYKTFIQVDAEEWVTSETSHCSFIFQLSFPGHTFSIGTCISIERSFSSVQSLSHVLLFATPWTAAHQASLSITNSQSLLKLMSVESVMPPNHLILCCPLVFPPLIFPSIRSFPVSQLFASGGQSIGVSASASVLPMNIQDWFPLGWTGWISLQSRGFSRVFSNTTVQKVDFTKKALFGQLNSNSYSLNSLCHLDTHFSFVSL